MGLAAGVPPCSPKSPRVLNYAQALGRLDGSPLLSAIDFTQICVYNSTRVLPGPTLIRLTRRGILDSNCQGLVPLDASALTLKDRLMSLGSEPWFWLRYRGSKQRRSRSYTKEETRRHGGKSHAEAISSVDQEVMGAVSGMDRTQALAFDDSDFCCHARCHCWASGEVQRGQS